MKRIKMNNATINATIDKTRLETPSVLFAAMTDKSNLVRKLDELLSFYLRDLEIPILDESSEYDDIGMYGVFLRAFYHPHYSGYRSVSELNGTQWKIDTGRYQGKTIRIDIYPRGDMRNGRARGIYNHWAIQKIVEDYPRIFVAFARREQTFKLSEGRLDLTRQEKYQRIPQTILQLYQLMDQLRGKIDVLALPGILYTENGIYFRHPEKLRIEGGCDQTSDMVCTYYTSTVDNKDLRIPFLAMICHLWHKHKHPKTLEVITALHPKLVGDLPYVADLLLSYRAYLDYNPIQHSWEEMQRYIA